MRFLRKKIQMDVVTLIAIVVITGVTAVHISQTEFGQRIAEIVAIIGLFFVGLGIWMFLNLAQQLYGKRRGKQP